MSSNDFVRKFYNIEGDLISERKKNLFQLIESQNDPLTEEELNSLRPRTYLESLFQIEIFIYFRIYPKLLEVLKNGNRVFVKKILKRGDILKEAVEDMSPEFFVNDFLPSTSFTVRMKVLRKVCVLLDEAQMDQIISCVYARYGFNITVKILHAGSFQKIKEFLRQHDVILTSRQLKFMFDKNPDILVEYLHRHKVSMGSVYTHTGLSTYVALKNPIIWLQVQKNHTLSFANLGYRTSRNFIRRNKEDFLNNIRSYSMFLKFSSIVEELQGHFAEIYADTFPKEIHNINLGNFCHKLLQHYPKKDQWPLFSETFQQLYGKNIMDNLTYLKYGFVQQFGDRTILNKWAKERFNKEKTNYILMFCEPSIAIDIIKERISNTADISDRTELIVLLLDNCAENESLHSLVEVLKYICQYISENKDSRHLYNVASLSLHKLASSFKLNQLNDSHWKYIIAIITFIRQKNQVDYYCFTDVFTVALKNLEYLIENEKPFKVELEKFIEDVDSNSSWFHIDLKNPNIERRIWIEIINKYPQVVSEQYKSLKRQQEMFIVNVINFNERNPDYAIDLSSFPVLLNHVHTLCGLDSNTLSLDDKDVLKKVICHNLKFPDNPIVDIEEDRILRIFRENRKDFCYESFWEMLIAKHNRTAFENELLQLFWENLTEFQFLSKRIVSWLFINEPKTILPRFEHLLTLDKRFIDINYVKLMSHLGFDKKVVDYCMCKLEVSCNFFNWPSVKRNISDKRMEINVTMEVIDMLARLLPTNKFIDNVVRRFLPHKEVTDTEDFFFMLSCEVARSLKRIEEPIAVVDIVMVYCAEDYLGFTLPALYSICYRVPESLLYAYLDKLYNMSISTQSHALFLSCELLRLDYVLNKLQDANEAGASGKKYVFTAILKFFRKNPSEELLNMVVANLSNIDKDDSDALSTIAITEIPKKYTDMYIQKCWYFFENMRKKEVNVQMYLQLVLDSIMRSDSLVESLSPDFCRHIITNYFIDTPQRDHYLTNIGQFVCMFLIRQKSNQEFNFTFVFNILARFKSNNGMEIIKNFFNSFYDFAVEDVKAKNIIDQDHNHHIELFKRYWFNIFTPIKMFDEYLLINFLYLRCKAAESNFIDSYAREISNYLEELVDQYGPFIYYKFKSLLLHHNPFTEKEKHMFLYSLLQYKNSTLNCMLVMDLLDSCSFDREIKRIHFQILDILKQSTDPVVVIYYNSCFGDDM